jgi:hypothetical protein
MKNRRLKNIGALVCLVTIAMSALAGIENCNNKGVSGDDSQTTCTNCDTGRAAPNGSVCTWHKCYAYGDAYCGVCKKDWNCHKTGSHPNTMVYCYELGGCVSGFCSGGSLNGAVEPTDSNSEDYCG